MLVRQSLSHFYTIPTQGLVPPLVGRHSHLSQHNQDTPPPTGLLRKEPDLDDSQLCLDAYGLSINSLTTLLKVQTLTNIFLLTLFPGLFQKPFPVS